MTSEFLLEAMGLLDDDLIGEALAAPRRRAVNWGRVAGLCACLALVILVGRGMVQNWGGVAGNTASGSAGASSAGAAGEPSPSTGEGSGSAASGNTDSPNEPAYLLLGNLSYAYAGEVIDQLPPGAEKAGVLALSGAGAPSPSTNWEDYVGCTLYVGTEGMAYVQTAEGAYAVFAIVEPAP